MGSVLQHEKLVRSWPKLCQHKAKGQDLWRGICMPLSENDYEESAYMLVKYPETLQWMLKQLLLAQNT
jgi:hypothetical protein